MKPEELLKMGQALHLKDRLVNLKGSFCGYNRDVVMLEECKKELGKRGWDLGSQVCPEKPSYCNEMPPEP